MRSPFVLIAVLTVMGCSDVRLHDAADGLRISPDAQVTFPRTPLDGATVQRVRVFNSGATAVPLTVAVQSPFRAEAPAQVPGHGHVTVELFFEPKTLGDATGTLLVDGAKERLSLRGTAGPACEDSLCKVAGNDPETGVCTGDPLPDGTACGNACVSAGQCLAGECIGENVDCSDGDACTVDACDVAHGCVSTPVACEAPEDPCRAAYCDPAKGCADSPAPDGTSCGPKDCVTAHVCISGACVERPTPDGAACGEPSPCQPLGVCRAGECQRAPATPLTESWSWQEPGASVVNPPVIDRSGNLYPYTVKGGGTSPRLWRLSRDGAVRFEAHGPFSVTQSAMWHEDLLINRGGLGIRALDAVTGEKVWEVSARLVALEHFGVTASIAPDSIWAHSTNEVGVFLELECPGCSVKEFAPVWLDAQTGAVLRVGPTHWGTQVEAGVTDGTGTVYFSRAGPGETGALHAMDSDGRTVWSDSGPEAWHTHLMSWKGSLLGTRLATQSGCHAQRGYDAVTGRERFESADFLPVSTAWNGLASYRATASVFFSVGYLGKKAGCFESATQAVVRIDPATGEIFWTRPISYFPGQLILTDSQSLLVSELDRSTGKAVLHHLDFEGRPLWTCDLPERTEQIVGLHQGRAFFRRWSEDGTGTGLMAVDLPGLDLAKEGWLTEWGDPEHRRRPRLKH